MKTRKILPLLGLLLTALSGLTLSRCGAFGGPTVEADSLAGKF
jgi:hypothetical protein